MAVTITWSSTNGGSAITSVDHGEGSADEILTAQQIYVRHDGVSPISQCKFYLDSSGSNPTADLSEVLGWGDGATAASFGGFMINMDSNGNFPFEHWSTYNDKSDNEYNVFRTGVGDSSDNGILLAKEMGLSGSAGTIQAGSTPNVSFKCRIQVPTDETTTGVRQFDQKMRFSYTS